MSCQLITSDEKHGTSYIYLFGKYLPGSATRTVPVGSDVCVDFDSDGHLIGIELLRRELLHPALHAAAVAPDPSQTSD
jgi:uncharacterized protein YuzE